MARAWRSVAGGMLTTEVRVERATGTIGGGGGTVPGEPEVIYERVPASIEVQPITAQAREHATAGGVGTHITHIVRMRRAAALDVRATDVLVELQDPERRLEIIARNNDVIAKEIQCLCVEQEAISGSA